jgi:hypothetical protein
LMMASGACSGPRRRNASAFCSDPTTATTLQPASLASCTAKCPVPPAAAVTATVSPACMPPVPCRAAQAVTPDRTSATASGVAAGTGVHMAALAMAYSEKAAAPLQATAWPTCGRVGRCRKAGRQSGRQAGRWAAEA